MQPPAMLFLGLLYSLICLVLAHSSSTALTSVALSTTTETTPASEVHLRAKRQFGGCCGMMPMMPMCCMGMGMGIPRPIPIPVPVPQPIMMMPPPMPPPMMMGSCCGCCVPVCMPMCIRGGCGCGGMGMGMGMFGRKKREALIRSNHPVLRLDWKKDE